MAKAFISFLGTNDYLECSYKYQDNIIKNVRFVQEATIKLTCMDWTENDRIIIFTTNEAFEKNWKDNGHKDRKTDKYFERTGLEKRINDLNLNVSFKNIDIPNGKTETEIWDIFSIVFEQIYQDDEIIFDITHAFRSVPMLAMVILNYARVIKNISLQGWFYGAMEAVGSYYDVQQMPVEKRVLPIFDLTSFDQLVEWSNGIDLFLKTGNAEQVSNIAEKSANMILSQTKGKEKSQYTIRKFAGCLNSFTKTLSTCRGRNISKSVISLKQNLNDCKKIKLNSPLNKPLQPLFKKIEDHLKLFEEKQVEDGIQAARWCCKHNLIQQGYTILQETLITYFVLMVGEDPENFDEKNIIRTVAPQAIFIFLNDTDIENWAKEAQDKIELTHKFIKLYGKLNIKLLKTYKSLTDFRNDINHCGQNDNPKTFTKIENKLEKFIIDVEENIF